jgi:hypothetical protein
MGRQMVELVTKMGKTGKKTDFCRDLVKCFIAQAGLELSIFLPQSPECTTMLKVEDYNSSHNLRNIIQKPGMCALSFVK